MGYDIVDLPTVCILKMVHDQPRRSQTSVAPNPACRLRAVELILRGYLSRPAKFSGLTITPKGDELLDKLMDLVREFHLEEELDMLITITEERAEHRAEYSKEFDRKTRDARRLGDAEQTGNEGVGE